MGQRAQPASHQLGKHLPGQPSAPIGAAALIKGVLKEHGKVLGEGASLVHDMKSQRAQQVGQSHARLAASPFANARQAGQAQQLLPSGSETSGRLCITGKFARRVWSGGALSTPFSGRTLGMFSHSKGK